MDIETKDNFKNLLDELTKEARKYDVYRVYEITEKVGADSVLGHFGQEAEKVKGENNRDNRRHYWIVEDVYKYKGLTIV